MGAAISNFNFITINQFIELNAKNYKNEKEREQERKSLKHYLRLRDEGHMTCMVCENEPIWVVGSASVNWCGCFTCITGESDASEDYDIQLGG